MHRETREMEAFKISARFELLDEFSFELLDEFSEMPGHGSRKGVVLVLQALPNC
jgi:hypothetical protein